MVAVIAPAAMAEWDRRVTQCLQHGKMPLETGVGPHHSWVTEQRLRRQPHAAVGIQNGNVQWVAYQAAPIRQHTYNYWKAHRPP